MKGNTATSHITTKGKESPEVPGVVQCGTATLKGGESLVALVCDEHDRMVRVERQMARRVTAAAEKVGRPGLQHLTRRAVARLERCLRHPKASLSRVCYLTQEVEMFAELWHTRASKRARSFAPRSAKRKNWLLQLREAQDFLMRAASLLSQLYQRSSS